MEKDRKIKLAMEAEKIKKIEDQHKQRSVALMESRKESELEKQRKDEELEQQTHLERLRLETLRRLNEEHGRKLKLFVAETRNMPRSDNSKHKLEEVSSEARRQSIAVSEVEQNINAEQRRETCNRISSLESSIANLDWELERFEIEKMKAKTEKVKKQMTQSRV